jgi:uncharacterized protein YegJ (DUF2314 family)
MRDTRDTASADHLQSTPSERPLIRLIGILFLLAVAVWALRRLVDRVTGGEVRSHPPLVMEPDDPLLIDAVAQARATLPEFRKLVAQVNRGARVKVKVVSDTGAEETVWADVIALADQDVEIRLAERPVSQRGPIHAIQKVALGELLDWQVELTDGRFAGGYTMRAMFRKGREQWGSLPRDLAAEERRYQ